MGGWSQILKKIKGILRYYLGGSAGKESDCSAGDMGSVPGLERSPGERKSYPTPVFWPGEFHGLYSPWGHKDCDMTERLSLNKDTILCSSIR